MNALRPLHLLAVIVVIFVGSHRSLAHCDALDGPVVKAAQTALADGKVNRVLIWVQPRDEAELREAFQRTLAVRKLNADSQALADRFFFETLVRLHRAGEGAPYTGLKPAGRDLGPAIAAADRAIESGRMENVVGLLAKRVEEGVRRRFQAVASKKKFDLQDVEAGRAWVQTYVDFIHYIEGVHESAVRETHEHSGSAASPGTHHESEAK